MRYNGQNPKGHSPFFGKCKPFCFPCGRIYHKIETYTEKVRLRVREYGKCKGKRAFFTCHFTGGRENHGNRKN